MSGADASAPSWQLLQQMPALVHLEPERLQWLARHMHWQILQPGELLQEPCQDTRLRWVVHGLLEMRYVSSQGKELLLGEFDAGHLLGHPSEQPLTTIHFSLKAVRPVLLATLEGAALHSWMNSDATILRDILDGVTELLWRLVWRVVEMGTMNVRSRLHMRLLLAQRQGVQDNQVLLSPSPHKPAWRLI